MVERIQEKIDEIEKYLAELGEIIPESYEEYIKNFEKKAACERYCEKIIEAVVDLAFLVIKEKKLRIPEDDSETFDILAEERIINEALAKKLKEAKGMRNIIAHEYGKIDNEVVFHAITEEVENDLTEFLEKIKKFLC